MGGYILIVESDPALQRRIGDTLKEAHYELASEAEGVWARRSIAVRAPDAIVVDTMLSDEDGFRLAEDLRRDPDTRVTPIFFIASRFRGASHRAEARRRFAPAEYLPVPLDVNSLLALILQAVPPARQGTPAEIHTATTQKIADPQAAAAAATAATSSGMAPVGATPTPTAAQRGLDGSVRDPTEHRERREVERTAKTLVAEKSELTGNVKLVPFASLLQRLYARRSSGSLLLLRGGAKKIVSFVDGYPVAVRSNLLTECLGQILVRQKTISNEALAESVKRMQKEKRRQGEILVEMGALSPYNLSRALVEQGEAKLFEIFSWRDGQFTFKEGDAAPKGAMRLARSPAALILEGIRRHYDSARQVAVLDGFAGRFVVLNSNPILRMQEMSSDPTELSFIHSIAGHERLEDLLNGAPIARDKAALLLVGLSEAGVITPADVPTERSRVTVAPTSARPAVMRHEAHTGDPGEIEVSSADLLGDLDGDQLPEMPVPAPSSQPAGDCGQGVEHGADALRALDIEPPGDPVDDQVLSATPLGSVPLSMVAQTVRTQDYFWALGVERAASADEIDRAYEALARTFHADGYRNSPPADRKLAQEIFDRLSEAHGVLCDPDQRQAYTSRIDAPDVAATPPAATAAASATPPAGPTGATTTTAGNAAAQAFYGSGLEHLRARRHHEAVEAFRQAARLVPGEANFRAALGWSLFREAPADARAGRAALAELRRAIQIDQRNLGALHYLANYYAETGQSDLAIDELERILQIDPGAAEATDQLRRLRDR
jgi:DNA-binding response OmpR family regulator/tetratricopeptide (TPR) repeat protein